MSAKTIAVIPARGGSKRIPRKNIRNFCGKPMLAWSIAAAQKSGCFDHILVSTDDEAIAQLAKDLGAEVPFMRPAELADDYSTTTAVMAHAVTWFEQQRGDVAAACCIYATAPFIRSDDLRQAQALLLSRETSTFVACGTKFAYPIQRAFRLKEDQSIVFFQPEHLLTRSQDLEDAWHDAGQFYWGRAKAWQENDAILSAGTLLLPLPAHRVQDIDNEDDWTRAELLFSLLQARGEI